MIKKYLLLDGNNKITNVVTCTPEEVVRHGAKYVEYTGDDFTFEFRTNYHFTDGEIVASPNLDVVIPREEKVKNIKVTTTSGKVFDGDETSQDRMTRAINIANITGDTETQWKLADNSIVTVTLDELKEALSLSGQEMSRIWLAQ